MTAAPGNMDALEVVSVCEVSPKRYPGEYKIKYFIGRKGKPVRAC